MLWHGYIIKDSLWNQLNGSDQTLIDRKLQQLLSGQFKSFDQKPENTYTIRLNKADRLLLRTITVRDKLCLQVLDIIDQHNYQKYFKNQQLRKIYPDSQDLHLPEESEKTGELTKPLPRMRGENIYFYQKEHVALSDEQQITVRFPGLVTGLPGSGKSLISQIMLAEHEADDVEIPALYITKSAYLCTKMMEDYQSNISEIPYQTAGSSPRKILFLTYDMLLKHLTGKPLITEIKFDGQTQTLLDHFSRWFTAAKKKNLNIFDLEAWFQKIKSYFQKGFTLEELIYQEFKIACAYPEINGYLECGIKNSLIDRMTNSDHLKPLKSLIYRMFHEYNASFDGLIHPDFHRLNIAGRYPLILVDESQDFVATPLLNLYNLSMDKRVVFFADSRQILDAYKSSRHFLNLLGLEDNKINLPYSHRSAFAINDHLNRFIHLRDNLIGGLIDDEATTVHHAPMQQAKGRVSLSADYSSIDALQQKFRGTQIAVIHHADVSRDEVREKFKDITSLFYTPEQCKGLQFECVIGYELLSHPLVREANLKLEQIGIDKLKAIKHKAKSPDERFIPIFNQIFVSISRAINEFIYFEPEIKTLNHQIKTVIEVLQLQRLVPACSAAAAASISDGPITMVTTNEDWEIKLTEQIRMENMEVARDIWVINLNRNPDEFDKYKDEVLRKQSEKLNKQLDSDQAHVAVAASSGELESASAASAIEEGDQTSDTPQALLSGSAIKKDEAPKKSLKADKMTKFAHKLSANPTLENISKLFALKKDEDVTAILFDYKTSDSSSCLLEELLASPSAASQLTKIIDSNNVHILGVEGFHKLYNVLANPMILMNLISLPSGRLLFLILNAFEPLYSMFEFEHLFAIYIFERLIKIPAGIKFLFLCAHHNQKFAKEIKLSTLTKKHQNRSMLELIKKSKYFSEIINRLLIVADSNNDELFYAYLLRQENITYEIVSHFCEKKKYEKVKAILHLPNFKFGRDMMLDDYGTVFCYLAQKNDLTLLSLAAAKLPPTIGATKTGTVVTKRDFLYSIHQKFSANTQDGTIIASANFIAADTQIWFARELELSALCSQEDHVQAFFFSNARNGNKEEIIKFLTIYPGTLDLFRKLLLPQSSTQTSIFDYAAANGHAGFIDWLYSQIPQDAYPDFFTSEMFFTLMDTAILYFQIAVIEWVIDHIQDKIKNLSLSDDSRLKTLCFDAFLGCIRHGEVVIAQRFWTSLDNPEFRKHFVHSEEMPLLGLSLLSKSLPMVQWVWSLEADPVKRIELMHKIPKHDTSARTFEMFQHLLTRSHNESDGLFDIMVWWWNQEPSEDKRMTMLLSDCWLNCDLEKISQQDLHASFKYNPKAVAYCISTLSMLNQQIMIEKFKQLHLKLASVYLSLGFYKMGWIQNENWQEVLTKFMQKLPSKTVSLSPTSSPLQQHSHFGVSNIRLERALEITDESVKANTPHT